MAKFIGKDIVSKLASRLFVRDNVNIPGSLELSPVLVVTTDVDRLLLSPKVGFLPTVDPGGTGYFTLFTVPEGKRWWIHSVNVAKVTGTTLATNTMYIADLVNAAILEEYTATADHALTYPQMLPLLAGWKLRTWVSAYTAGDTLNSRILYTEEDAY